MVFIHILLYIYAVLCTIKSQYAYDYYDYLIKIVYIEQKYNTYKSIYKVLVCNKLFKT